jgi:hypothetical protein
MLALVVDSLDREFDRLAAAAADLQSRRTAGSPEANDFIDARAIPRLLVTSGLGEIIVLGKVDPGPGRGDRLIGRGGLGPKLENRGVGGIGLALTSRRMGEIHLALRREVDRGRSAERGQSIAARDRGAALNLATVAETGEPSALAARIKPAIKRAAAKRTKPAQNEITLTPKNAPFVSQGYRPPGATPAMIVSMTCFFADSNCSSVNVRPFSSDAISWAALAYCWVVAQIM